MSIGDKLKDLCQKVDFFHLQYKEPANKIHGWISPKGDYHHLAPTVDHKDWIKQHVPGGAEQAHSQGWIEAGNGGQTQVATHSSVLSNKLHPAVRKLRELVGQHWGEDFQVHMSDKPDSLETASTKHFSRHGTIKKMPSAYFKSIGEQLSLLKDLSKK